MYDETVKRLRESKNEQCYIGCFGNCGDCKIDAELEQAADSIEKLSAIREEQKAQIILMAAEERHWIPVTERLPEYGDWVLGIGPKRGYHVCEYRGITHFPYSGDSPWFSAKGRKLAVTHWMPLPEPPKEET